MTILNEVSLKSCIITIPSAQCPRVNCEIMDLGGLLVAKSFLWVTD